MVSTPPRALRAPRAEGVMAALLRLGATQYFKLRRRGTSEQPGRTSEHPGRCQRLTETDEVATGLLQAESLPFHLVGGLCLDCPHASAGNHA